MKILVVGAGISGLSAAWTLLGRTDSSRAARVNGVQAHEVQVLGANDEVGGRIRTELVSGHAMELGAQFLSSQYEVVPQLVEAMDLDTSRIESGTGVVQGGTLRRFRSDRPLSQFTGGVLPWRAGPRAAVGLARVWAECRDRPLSDLTQWTDQDDERGSAWATRVMGPDVADRLLGPTVNGFYFQSLDESSAALPAAVVAFGVRAGSTLTIAGGLGQLTRRLADRLDVRLRTPVTSVRREGQQVRVTTPEGIQLADRVVLAVPGQAAQAILSDATDDEQALMAAPYSRGLVVGLPLGEPLRADQLAASYGVVVHPGEPIPIAGVAVASRAHPASGPGDLLTVMLDAAAAAELYAADHATIVGETTEALLSIDPSLNPLISLDPRSVRVVRHREAMPTCPIGHAARVTAHRHSPTPGPVVLAGDYLGFPWADSAAGTGVWAAHAALGGAEVDAE